MSATRTLLAVAAAGLLWMLPACGDSPFDVTWTANPDTVLLYSLARPEPNLPAAFDFVPTRRRRVLVEAAGATGNWDMAVDTRDGRLVFVAPSALGVDSRAGIASFPDMTLEELQEAPSDSAAYALTDPVPVDAGTAYVVRTRDTRSSFGRVCSNFAELRPLEIDPGAGTVRFVYDVNPQCNDRSLVPDRFPQ